MHKATLRLLLPLLLLLTLASAADEKTAPEFQPIDDAMNEAVASGLIPGGVVIVGHHGKIVYRKAFGQRSLESGGKPALEPMTLDTIFDCASLTKVTATTPSLMRLFQEGKFRLNDPVSKYIPEFGQNGKEDITIRQLFTHYSGLREDLDLKQPWSGVETAKQMAFGQVPVSPPGSVFRYSDINFEVLGWLVEKLSGMPLDEYARKNIYEPLKMNETRYLPPKEWLPRIAPTEYDENNVMLRGIVHDPTARRMGGVAGHAGLFSTADDLARYAQAMIDAVEKDKGTDSDFLAGLTVEKATTPQQPPNGTSLRGLGWDIDSPFASNRGELFPIGSYGHTGFTGTSLWIDPYSKSYVILMTNAVHPHVGHSVVALRTRVATISAAALNIKKELGDRQPLLSITGYNEAGAGARRQFSRNGSVLTGIDVLESTNFASLKPSKSGAPRRIGLLTNQTGLDSEGRRTIDVLNQVPGLRLKLLFAPEHGAIGALDTMAVGDTSDPATKLPVYVVYGDTDAKRRPAQEQLKQLDAVVIDLQDIGVRCWTYETTVGFFLEEAAKAGIEVYILDRPDPITEAIVQGPMADADKLNFVSYHPLPFRHGMTMGELARLFNSERKINANLTVVTMQGYQPGDWFDATSLPWINPSPNMRSLTEATLYPGVAMIEGTNVSVGRGTDTPFELVGAPWIKSREFAAFLNSRLIAGVRFVPVSFTPKSGPNANQLCGGVNIVLLDRYTLDAPQMGLELAAALHKFYPNDFQIQKMLKILANQETMDALLAGRDVRWITAVWREHLEQEFLPIREKYLLYDRRTAK